MIERKYEKQAAELVQAIKDMAANEDTLRNFQFYLEIHFGDWLKKYASTPDGIAWEFKQFTSIA